MSAQAQMILKKKQEIEAKMLATEEGKLGGPGRKPITMSINKRW
jgi:hypothetical protein